MELKNEAMKRQVESSMWLIEHHGISLNQEQKEYLQKALTRLVISCLGIEKRGALRGGGGDAA